MSLLVFSLPDSLQSFIPKFRLFLKVNLKSNFSLYPVSKNFKFGNKSFHTFRKTNITVVLTMLFAISMQNKMGWMGKVGDSSCIQEGRNFLFSLE